MAELLTCPSCQRRLRLPENIQTAWFTCPACLAKFQNPATQITSEPAVSGAAGRAESVRPRRETVPRSHIVEHEVHQDTKRTGVGMILLAVFGGIAIGYSLLGGLGILIGGKDVSFLFNVILGIVFLGLISTGIMLWRTRDNPSERGVGRVVLGTLQLAGALIVIPFLLAMAALIFLFALCLAGGLKF